MSSCISPSCKVLVVGQFEPTASEWPWSERPLPAYARYIRCTGGLEIAPSLHFELEEVFTVPSGYAASYRRDNGNRVLDVVELDDSSRAVSVKAFYLGHQK
jgi:hypothetical protein